MSTFTAIATVAVPVTDQDRTKSLYLALGLEERFDTELQPGFRWIEVGAPGAATSLAIVAASADGLPTGIDTGIRLLTEDARAAHASLSAIDGLDVGELLDWESAPLMFSFRDFDGNVLYVSQSS